MNNTNVEDMIKEIMVRVEKIRHAKTIRAILSFVRVVQSKEA